jgi:hypothetical protein
MKFVKQRQEFQSRNHKAKLPTTQILRSVRNIIIIIISIIIFQFYCYIITYERIMLY